MPLYSQVRCKKRDTGQSSPLITSCTSSKSFWLSRNEAALSQLLIVDTSVQPHRRVIGSALATMGLTLVGATTHIRFAFLAGREIREKKKIMGIVSKLFGYFLRYKLGRDLYKHTARQ
ncbi:hypothetical protein H0G86_002315 [Trichoderma simmonsii]|uniref:Uncharacterized protein n=1 Tax=Trichoderma simmonsii TaxID=1491479 RepID=A0A8G0PFV0_9HYPO|nr:hypothetical protein H0G86_002315 [Trichoderma simmonsii]